MTTIDLVGLSTRAYNCLRNAGYTTLDAVRAASDQDLLDIRNMGVRSLHEIREKIGGGSIVEEVRRERWRQDQRWGQQNHPDGTSRDHDSQAQADFAREWCQAGAEAGNLTWRDILNEEVCEAFAEDDPAKLRIELIQVAAVAVAWIEAIDRRAADTSTTTAASLRPSPAYTRRAPQVIPPEFEAALLRRVEEDPDAETAELLDRYHGDLYRQLIQEAWGAAYAAALGYQVTVSGSGDRLEVGDQTADRSPATPTTADDIFAEPDAIARNYPHLHQDGGDRA